MNNGVIKGIACVASGALFGALGGYYVANKAISEKYEEIVKEIEGSTRKRVKDLEEKIEIYQMAGLKFEIAKAIAERNQKMMEEADKKITEESKIKDNDYSTYSKMYKGTQEDEAEPKEETVEPKNNFPYIIGPDQFADECEDYDKISCTLYVDDMVLYDEQHKVVVDNSRVGEDNELTLRDGNLEFIYVRNDELKVDYEVERYEGNFSYEVLGEESLDDDAE